MNLESTLTLTTQTNSIFCILKILTMLRTNDILRAVCVKRRPNYHSNIKNNLDFCLLINFC